MLDVSLCTHSSSNRQNKLTTQQGLRQQRATANDFITKRRCWPRFCCFFWAFGMLMGGRSRINVTLVSLNRTYCKNVLGQGTNCEFKQFLKFNSSLSVGSFLRNALFYINIVVFTPCWFVACRDLYGQGITAIQDGAFIGLSNLQDL